MKPLTLSSSSPSTSSSPPHDFSFTISLHHPPMSFTAIDLSPADEIFFQFHGHLLPLHLLDHLSMISPRSSTNSLDNFTLPMHQLLLQDQINPHQHSTNFIDKPKYRSKFNSFSLFRLSKWRKGYENNGKEDQEKHKKTLKFDVKDVLESCFKMLRPLLGFRGSRNKQFRGRRGELSAPASMRTSPTNSGLLVATGKALASSCCNSENSSVEELQGAIQAAIAHCKKSIAME